VQLVNPLDQNHGRVVVLADLELLADGIDELIQVKHHIFGGKARENGVLDLVINLLGELPDFGRGRTDQRNDVVEDLLEVLIPEHRLPVVLEDVEDGVAGC